MLIKTMRRFQGIKKLVDSANDGQDCIMKAKAGLERGQIYSLVLMDLSMPTVDGYEAAEALREVYEDFTQPKIIACTGHCEQEFIAKAWRHDIDEMISKPIKASLLE